MADVTVVGAEHPGRSLARRPGLSGHGGHSVSGRRSIARLGQRCGFRLDHAQGVAFGAGLLAVAAVVAIVAVAFAKIAVTIAEAVLAGPVVSRPVVPGTVLLWPVVTRAIVTRAIVSGAIIPRPVVPGAIIARTIIPRAVVPGPVIAVTGAVVVPRPVISLPVFPGTIVARPVVSGPVVAEVSTLALTLAFEAVLTVTAALGAGLFALAAIGFRIVLPTFGAAVLVLEIDVVAGDELVPVHDLGHRALRLHGAQGAEIVFGVLKVVFGQDPVAGGTGVAGELLVLLVHMLGGAANLHPVGPVGIESPVGVVLRLAAAATAVSSATAAAIPAPLTFHTLEISHASVDLLQTLPGRTTVSSGGLLLL